MALPAHGFGAAAFQLYEGQLIEVNTGETSSTILFDQEEVALKHIIRGILVDVVGDALILECAVPGGKKTIMINCWGILSIAPAEEAGMLKDCYFDEHSTRCLK